MTRDQKGDLTEEEFLHFVMEDLDEGEQAAVDAHVERCIDCAKDLEQFYEADASFPEAEWAARRPALVAALRLDAHLWQWREGLSRVWERFRSVVLPSPNKVKVLAPQLARAAAQEAVVDQQTPDGTLALYAAVDDETGTLTLRLESGATEHEGWWVVVGDEQWSCRSKLTRVTETVLGAEIKIPAEERAKIPSQTELGIRVGPETSAPMAGPEARRTTSSVSR